MRYTTLLGHIAAIMVVILWGTTFVSSKVLLNSGMQPAGIFAIRFVMAYVCMLMLSHRRLWADNIKDELTLVGLGVMGGSLYFLMENMALIYSTSANVSILVSTTPLVTALLLAVFYKSERLSYRQVIASVIAFVGVIMVVLNGQLILHLNPLGDSLALGASLTWAIYSLFMRRIMSRYNSDFITRKVFFYGLLTIVPYILFVEPVRFDTEMFTQPVVFGNLLYLGLVASTGGYLLWNWVMKRLGAVKSTNYIYLQPLVTMVVGVWILSERITWMGLLGALVLLIGMIGAVKK